MRKIFHYTRGYCPIPLEKRYFAIYIKTKEQFLNKFVILNPFGVLFLNFIFVLLSYFYIFLKVDFFHYYNFHVLTFGIKVLFFSIFFTNFLYFSILKDWENLEKLSKDSVINYEEIGILEERIWKKPIINLIQDNLILNYKIKPFIEKIKNQFFFYNTFMFLLVIFLKIFV